jgi:parallel beta-helix repeat protein
VQLKTNYSGGKMNKVLCVIVILLVSLGLTAQTIWTVRQDGNGDFLTIQSAINDNNVISGHTLSVYYFLGDTPYGAIDLGSKRLTIQAYSSHTPVISSSSTYVVNMGSDSNSSLSGFTITGNSSNKGIFINGLSNIEIENCEITDCEYGIYLNECTSAAVDECEFSSNDYGIYNLDTSAYTSDIDVTSCNFTDHDVAAIFIDGVDVFSLFYSLLYENVAAIVMCDDEYIEAYFDRCTIADNTTGISWGTYSDNEISNSIVFDNTTNLTGSAIDIDIEYSDIEGGGTTNGNINEDPFFCYEYYYEYHLMEGSPCIDTGDPYATGGEVRIDMGCFETTRDIKRCRGEYWNWVSYPRLYRTGNGDVDVVPLLEDFLDWDFDLEMLFEQIFYLNPILRYTDNNNTWTPISYNVISSRGYKLDPDDSGAHYLPTVNGATRLSASHTLVYTLEEDDDCWMGYWLPYTQNIEDAFGEFFDDLVSISSEDWYYEYSKQETPSSVTTNKDMVYGKGYVVVFETDIEDFCWTDATDRGLRDGGGARPIPQYFTFDDLPSYEAIDIMYIPDNVIEIGVYEGETCIGAVVVQNDDEQILAYSTIVNRDYVPLTFEVITNVRGENLIVNDYQVMDKDTGRWENRSLISGQQRSSVIMFGNLEDPQNNTPSLDEVVLHGNYPNPFNPETNISFSLPTEQNIELIIYNTKGQKVRQLLSGEFTSGSHSVTWDGKDNENKNVGSGLYLYKLKTNDQVFSKKMLLLK